MKTTALKASAALASKITSDLVAMKSTKTGKQIFFKRDTLGEPGWVVFGWTKIDGEKAERIVLKFTYEPAPRLEYDENLITLS